MIRNPRGQESVFLSATCHWQMQGAAFRGPALFLEGGPSTPHPQNCLPTLLCFFCFVCDLLIVEFLHLLMCSERGLEPLGSKGPQRLVSLINTQGRETVGGFQESVYFELCVMQKQGFPRKDICFNACAALPISNSRSCCWPLGGPWFSNCKYPFNRKWPRSEVLGIHI